jgi:hypothetical protein
MDKLYVLFPPDFRSLPFHKGIALRLPDGRIVVRKFDIPKPPVVQ